MFSDKNKKPDFSKEQNKIAQGTILTGDIQSDGSFRIEGEVKGNLDVKGKVVIGETGTITGEVICENADIEGTFDGKLKVKVCLTLKNTAKISGEVITDQLIVDAGASFNATCQMSGAVKTLEDGRKEAKKQQSKTA
jgi:cytoskeletal protein CcmA (bactofilin family)